MFIVISYFTEAKHDGYLLDMGQVKQKNTIKFETTNKRTNYIDHLKGIIKVKEKDDYANYKQVAIMIVITFYISYDASFTWLCRNEIKVS